MIPAVHALLILAGRHAYDVPVSIILRGTRSLHLAPSPIEPALLRLRGRAAEAYADAVWFLPPLYIYIIYLHAALAANSCCNPPLYIVYFRRYQSGVSTGIGIGTGTAAVRLDLATVVRLAEIWAL